MITGVASPLYRKIKLDTLWKYRCDLNALVHDERRRFTPIIDLSVAGEEFRLLASTSLEDIYYRRNTKEMGTNTQKIAVLGNFQMRNQFFLL